MNELLNLTSTDLPDETKLTRFGVNTYENESFRTKCKEQNVSEALTDSLSLLLSEGVSGNAVSTKDEDGYYVTVDFHISVMKDKKQQYKK